jgi:hypothetical protein
MSLDLNVLAPLVTTTGIGFLMIVSGIHKSAVRPPIEGRTCACTD